MKAVAILVALTAVGCTEKTKAPSTQGSAAGSGQGPTTVRLPREDMVTIAEGDYKTSALTFAPDEQGACSDVVIDKVSKMTKVAPWPDELQHVPAFSIDRTVTSCDDFDSCVAQDGCPKLRRDREYSCSEGRARVSLEAASKYCAWRKMRLPTLTQWQVAFRGTQAQLDADCNNVKVAAQYERCPFKSEFGVVGYFASAAGGEFTRTMACWPPDTVANERPSANLQPLVTANFAKALYGFSPIIDATQAAQSFRCVQDRAIVMP